jgi:hypothetical protein
MVPQPISSSGDLIVAAARTDFDDPVRARERVSSDRGKRSQDVRSLTFQQALPHLVRFSEDPAFVSAIVEVCVR